MRARPTRKFYRLRSTARMKAFAPLSCRLEISEGVRARSRGSDGIGSELAHQLCDKGASVVMHGYDPSRLAVTRADGLEAIAADLWARMGSVLLVDFALLAASRPLFSCPLRACSDPYASSGGPVW